MKIEALTVGNKAEEAKAEEKAEAAVKAITNAASNPKPKPLCKLAEEASAKRAAEESATKVAAAKVATEKIIAEDKNPKQDPDEVIYTKAPKPLSFIVARFLLKATEEASVTKENTNKAFEKNDTKGVPGAKVDANIDKTEDVSPARPTIEAPVDVIDEKIDGIKLNETGEEKCKKFNEIRERTCNYLGKFRRLGTQVMKKLVIWKE